MTYEAAKKRAEPYDKIVGELPEMRKDTVSLIQEATGRESVDLCPRQQPSRRECPADHSGTRIDRLQTERLKGNLDPQLLCSCIVCRASRREWGKRL
jgi:hypothetical protein